MNGKALRILLLLLAASALALTGCSSGGDVLDSNPGGRVQFTISSSTTAALTSDDDDDDDGEHHPGDKPRLTAANVTICGIVARNLEGQLIDVTIDLPVSVDLMSLDGDGTATLPAGFLPPGTYDQLIMVMCELELTTMNGTVITIDPPGGGWTTVIPTCPFTVAEGSETAVQLLFKPGRAFRWIDGRFQFHPSFAGDDDAGEPDPS